MRGIYRRTWVLNAIQIEAESAPSSHSASVDIPTMLLKGAAMIARWTGDSRIRMMADFDLLVLRERALEAGPRLLEADGDRRRSLRVAHRGPPGNSSTPCSSRAIGETARSPLAGADARSRFGAPDRVVWDRAQEVRLGEVSTYVQAPEDHVHHACSHATTWSSAGRVDWIADSALIIGGRPRVLLVTRPGPRPLRPLHGRGEDAHSSAQRGARRSGPAARVTSGSRWASSRRRPKGQRSRCGDACRTRSAEPPSSFWTCRNTVGERAISSAAP